MNINAKVFNEVGNKLTEYSGDYKWINPHILSGYYGLPKSFPKLAFILFGFIMRTKMYKDKAQTKDINEEKRIYNDIPITIEDILGEWDNSKYSSGQSMATDISNMNKRIWEMDENNVFHCWKYWDLYMFVMERDIRTWGFYNTQTKVTPKMLKKINVIGCDMLTCMIKNIRKVHGTVDKSDVERSFGLFINGIINKMNHLVSTEIPKWDCKQDVCEYLNHLSGVINNMEDYAGLIFATDILDKFPNSISKKLRKDMEEIDMKDKQPPTEKIINDLEKDLTPHDPNLVHIRKIKKSIHQSPSVNKPIAYEFSEDINPFADARQFVRYYHAFLQQCTAGQIKFDSYGADTAYATQVMDILIENKRADNKIFLNAWLRYFYEQRLKGSKAKKAKYTSIKIFKDTFGEFNARYIDIPIKSV